MNFLLAAALAAFAGGAARAAESAQAAVPARHRVVDGLDVLAVELHVPPGLVEVAVGLEALHGGAPD